jgi:hypothetical protein
MKTLYERNVKLLFDNMARDWRVMVHCPGVSVTPPITA